MTSEFDRSVATVRNGESSADDAALRLVRLLDDGEALGLLDGDRGFWSAVIDMGRNGYNHEPIVAGAVKRLGLPGIRFTDGPRGVVMGHSTCFPVSMARGATWDPDLETEIGRAIGAEGRAQGANLFAGVCVNLLRHPAWGRSQETYGEDPVLLGAMGSALARGVGEHLMACVKHFALNSMENARFVVDVTVDEDCLHEVYLPHFKAVIDAGAEAVMSAYNSVNGQWCGDSPVLLTEVLRNEWGFDGFVMSDFVFGHRDPVGSVAAGLDLEMPARQQRARSLPAALADGSLRRADVERACIRLVATQIRWAARVDGVAPDRRVVACGAHRSLARRAAAQSMVLLRNEAVDGVAVLPIDPVGVRRVAVIGALADQRNLGDLGSSAVRPPSVVTPIQGLRAALAGVDVEYDDGSEPSAAARLAAGCDVAIVVVGYTSRDEGEALVAPVDAAASLLPPPIGNRAISGVASWASSEASRRRLVPGGDRLRLTLRPHDEALIAAVAAAVPRTIVVVIGGGGVLMERWRSLVPGIVMAWYPGMEGGNALADVVCGILEPGGRLPFAIPTDVAHLPYFDADARHITYDRWWGQRLLDRDDHEAAFPLGFGLGYTEFSLSNVRVDAVNTSTRRVALSVDVVNLGARIGATVVQFYAVSDDSDRRDIAWRQLIGFARVSLGAGASRRVEVDATLQPLSRRDHLSHEWRVRPGRYHVVAAQYCGDPAGVVAPLDLG